MKKYTFFISFMLLTTPLLAILSEQPQNQCPSFYCPDAPSCNTFALRAEFLYWQPVITGMAYALTRTSVDVPFGPFGPGTVPDHLSIQNVDFK